MRVHLFVSKNSPQIAIGRQEQASCSLQPPTPPPRHFDLPKPSGDKQWPFPSSLNSYYENEYYLHENKNSILYQWLRN